ncbi:hypothetical protein ACLKA6_015916 [Drosophila palustris]
MNGKNKKNRQFEMAESSEKKATSKRVKWSVDHEITLIDLWEEKIGELRGNRKNSHIYMEMAEELKAEKSKIGPSGGTPSCWNHYEKVHMILGGLRMHDVNTERLSTTNFVEVMNDPILFDPETSTCSTESSRDYTKKHLEHLDNQREILREIADDNKTIIQDNKNIIEENKRFQKEIMDFLRTKK